MKKWIIISIVGVSLLLLVLYQQFQIENYKRSVGTYVNIELTSSISIYGNVVKSIVEDNDVEVEYKIMESRFRETTLINYSYFRFKALMTYVTTMIMESTDEVRSDELIKIAEQMTRLHSDIVEEAHRICGGRVGTNNEGVEMVLKARSEKLALLTDERSKEYKKWTKYIEDRIAEIEEKIKVFEDVRIE